MYFCLFGTRSQTQDIVLARQAQYCWAISLTLSENFFHPCSLTRLASSSPFRLGPFLESGNAYFKEWLREHCFSFNFIKNGNIGIRYQFIYIYRNLSISSEMYILLEVLKYLPIIFWILETSIVISLFKFLIVWAFFLLFWQGCKVHDLLLMSKYENYEFL